MTLSSLTLIFCSVCAQSGDNFGFNLDLFAGYSELNEDRFGGYRGIGGGCSLVFKTRWQVEISTHLSQYDDAGTHNSTVELDIRTLQLDLAYQAMQYLMLFAGIAHSTVDRKVTSHVVSDDITFKESDEANLAAGIRVPITEIWGVGLSVAKVYTGLDDVRLQTLSTYIKIPLKKSSAK